MARALGTDDSVTTCDCCGRTDLKFTVVIELDGGDLVHCGRVCASRNTGKTRPVINAEIKAEAARVLAVAKKEYGACPEYLSYRAKLAQRDREAVRPGLAAMAYVETEAAADDAARIRIAAKHGLKPYQLYI